MKVAHVIQLDLDAVWTVRRLLKDQALQGVPVKQPPMVVALMDILQPLDLDMKAVQMFYSPNQKFQQVSRFIVSKASDVLLSGVQR